MGLHTLRLETFPNPTAGKAAMKDVKACNKACRKTSINISTYIMTLKTKIFTNDCIHLVGVARMVLLQVASPWRTQRKPRDN